MAVVNERGIPKSVHGLAGWLERVAPPRARGTVCVALVSDGRMRELNRQYRGKDYATDVLSFEPGPKDPAYVQPSPQPPASSPYLGDIVIAIGVMHRQARKAGHSPRTELRLLALHGLLHLLGYDHERDGGQMRRVERRLRKIGGLREGLIDRELA